MKVLVLGQGELGWRTAQILAHYPAIEHVLAADVNPAQEGRTNMVRYGAHLLGLKTAVAFRTLDALDESAVRDLLDEYRPDAVINTASLQSWWLIQQLPRETWETIHSAGLGVWLPAHLAPAYVLMKALREAGQSPLVVNMAFADVVNVMLHRVGLSPTMGAGNIEELVAPFSRTVAQERGIDPERVRVRLVGHHWVNAAVLESRLVQDIPIIVHVEADGHVITDELDVPSLLLEATQAFPPGFEDTYLIAASASHKLLAAHGLAPVIGHATGFDGLPGGYPVRLTAGVPELDLPNDVSADDAVAVNLEGQRRDGVESIEEDGEAVLTDHARAVMREVLGWEYGSYRVEDSPDMAREITSRYREFAAPLLRAV